MRGLNETALEFGTAPLLQGPEHHLMRGHIPLSSLSIYLHRTYAVPSGPRRSVVVQSATPAVACRFPRSQPHQYAEDLCTQHGAIGRLKLHRPTTKNGRMHNHTGVHLYSPKGLIGLSARSTSAINATNQFLRLISICNFW